MMFYQVQVRMAMLDKNIELAEMHYVEQVCYAAENLRTVSESEA